MKYIVFLILCTTSSNKEWKAEVHSFDYFQTAQYYSSMAKELHPLTLNNKWRVDTIIIDSFKLK